MHRHSRAAAWLVCARKLSERHGQPHSTGVRASHAACGTAARRAGEPRAQRARADRPGRARRRKGAARRARPHAPLAPDAVALPLAGAPTSCCWRRPTCAPTMPASPTRSPPAASGSPARSSSLRGRSPFAIRAAEPGLGARAARLRLASPPRRRDVRQRGRDDRPQARRRLDQAQPRAAGAGVGAGDRRPPRHLLAVACGPAARWRRPQALRRRHAQPDRADHVSLHLLARRARRLSRAWSP